jgi:proteic killer suppression protein
MAILSFADKETEEFFKADLLRKTTRWRPVSAIAARKLDMLNYASILLDLRSPPGNQLEKLKGSLSGMHSIRINDQWRIVFRWTEAGPIQVRIIDYHK